MAKSGKSKLKANPSNKPSGPPRLKKGKGGKNRGAEAMKGMLIGAACIGAVALFFMFSWGGKTAFGRFADAAGFNQGDPKDGSSPANEKRPQGRLTPGGPPMERTTAKDDDGIDRLVPR